MGLYSMDKPLGPMEGSRSANTGNINFLELNAVYSGLQTLHDTLSNQHVRNEIENSTAVDYVNNMGGTHSAVCNEMARNTW